MAESNRKAAEADGPGGTENLEKVRDILFGSQMRDQDKRFARLEERLAKDLADVREESRRRLDALESFIKKEVQSLLDRIKVEQGQRVEAVKSLGQELKEMGKSFQTRAGELEDQTTQVQRDLREELLEQSKTLRDEIFQSQQASAASLDQAVEELRSEKTDRADLADLFTEMAVRLSGDEDGKKK